MSKKVKANDGIVYSGKVYIKYRAGDKTKRLKKHNSGKLALFTSIALSLGERIEEAGTYMPRYLMGKHEVSEDGWANSFSSKVLVQDRKYYKNGALTAATDSNTIRYMFIVPVNNLIPNKKIKKLQLLNERNSVCAEIDLDDPDEIDTDIAAALLIYWDLKFTDISAISN